MKSRIILFLLGFAVWLILAWPPSAQTGLVGVLIAAIVSILTGDMFVRRPYLLKQPSRYFYLLWYVPVLVWECFKANIDVA